MINRIGPLSVMTCLFLEAGLSVGIAAPSQIPALRWEERSDWINLKTDVTPAAIGDGRADDTAAIRKALAQLRCALDDLRRLGEADLCLNHPEASP